MKEIIQIMFSGFWAWVGSYLLIALIIGIPAKMIATMWNRFFRHWNIRKHGYPPSHCDADGDFKEEKE